MLRLFTRQSEPTFEQVFARRNVLRKAGVPLHKCLPLARAQLMAEQQGKHGNERNRP